MSAVTDTSPEVAEMVRVRLMARTAEERFVMGSRMFDAAREMILASLPANLSPQERRAMLFQRIYGSHLPKPDSQEEAPVAAGNVRKKD